MSEALPLAAQEHLLRLAAELVKHGLRLESVVVRKDRPYLHEYAIHTAGGTVKVKQEL